MRVLSTDEATVEAKLRSDLRMAEIQLAHARRKLASAERRFALRTAEVDSFVATGTVPRRKGVRQALEALALSQMLTRAQQQGRVQRQRGRS